MIPNLEDFLALCGWFLKLFPQNNIIFTTEMRKFFNNFYQMQMPWQKVKKGEK